MEIRVTERQVFKRCRRKWDYQRQGLKAPENYGAPWFGTTMHKCLENYYNEFDMYRGMDNSRVVAEYLLPIFRNAASDAPEQYQEKVASAVDLAKGMLEGYLEFSATDSFEIIATETQLKKEFKRHTLTGRIDLIVKHKGKLWIVDHKTYVSFPSVEHLEMDDQVSAYLYLCKENGLDVSGCIYNMLRKKLPAEPLVLKNGGLSQAKNIDTSYEKYYKRIIELGLDPLEYKETLDTLRNNPFFAREEIQRSKHFINNFEKQVSKELDEMGRKRCPIYPTYTQDCLWDCPYLVLCRTESDGSDTNFIKETMYK